MQILALDIGTSSVKAAILDVATADFVAPPVSEHYNLERPTPEAAVLPAERLWCGTPTQRRRPSLFWLHVLLPDDNILSSGGDR